jgi:acyl dehydratase
MPTVANGLDDLRKLAGADLGAGDWREITQQQIDTFADATDDHQWIHVDPERAKSGPFGGTIAHGYLTLALIIPMWTEMLRIDGIGMAVNYGLNRVRFPAPVPSGGQIRLRARVDTVEDIPDGVQMTVDLTIELRDATKPAAVAQAVYRYYK